MKRIIAVVLVFTLLQPGYTKAQMEKGNYSFSFGYGYPNFQRVSNWLRPDKINYRASDLGPLHIKALLCMTRKIEVSLNINYAEFTGNWQKEINGTLYNYHYESGGTAGLIRCNIHEAIGKTISGYWGCAVGAGNLKRFSFTDNPNDEGFNRNQNIGTKSFETTIGIRACFTHNLGVYTEIGYAKSIVQAGLIITFNSD